MKRPDLPLADIARMIKGREPGFQSIPDLLGHIAQSVQADVIQLGIDLGTGYRRDFFIEQAAESDLLSDSSHPPFVITRETRVRRNPSPSGLVAAPDWMEQHALSIGTAGRRNAPRSGIALMRSPARPIFKPSERRQLVSFLPHLNTAITLAFELECTRQREAYANAMLEQTDYGLLLITPQGAPLHGNQLAFSLLEQARINIGQRLILPSRHLQSQFSAALACVSAPGGDAATFLVPGPPPVVLTLRPTVQVALPDSPAPKTITLILKSAQSQARLPDYVAQHFSLTPAEFRLCEALAQGASLKACAQKWARSYDTLRSQLKVVLAKTETHRQTELIALLNLFKTP